jgi:hypothetical protein
VTGAGVLGGLGGLAGLAGLGGLFAPAGAAQHATQSPSALEAQAIHDAEGSSWVHEVIHSNAPGDKFNATNDIGTFEGRQVIALNASRAQVIQIGQEAYIQGNASAIANFFGLTKNDPQQLANTWISMVPSDGQAYQTVSAAVTLKSDFQHQTIPGPLTEGRPVTVEGHRCIPLTGHATEPNVGKVTVTMYVTHSSTPLPVETRATAKKIVTTTSWSRWGQQVTLNPPAGAISFSSLNL